MADKTYKWPPGEQSPFALEIGGETVRFALVVENWKFGTGWVATTETLCATTGRSLTHDDLVAVQKCASPAGSGELRRMEGPQGEIEPGSRPDGFTEADFPLTLDLGEGGVWVVATLELFREIQGIEEIGERVDRSRWIACPHGYPEDICLECEELEDCPHGFGQKRDCLECSGLTPERMERLGRMHQFGLARAMLGLPAPNLGPNHEERHDMEEQGQRPTPQPGAATEDGAMRQLTPKERLLVLQGDEIASRIRMHDSQTDLNRALAQEVDERRRRASGDPVG